jgi:hypothetical protein
MKENKIHRSQCQNIDDLISKKLSGEFSGVENSLLSEHLLDCQSCRNAVTAAENLFESLHFSHEKSLNPDPALRQRLRKRVKRLKQNEKPAPQMPLDFIINLLRIRVPVYQAVIGMVIFLGILLYSNYLTFPNTSSLSEAPESAQYADSTGQMDTIRTSGPEKLGRSIREDSLLAKFFMTVM